MRVLAEIFAGYLGSVAKSNCSPCPKEFFHARIVLVLLFYPPSADISLIAYKENFQNAGNGCRKSHFMQLGQDSKDKDAWIQKRQKFI